MYRMVHQVPEKDESATEEWFSSTDWKMILIISCNSVIHL